MSATAARLGARVLRSPQFLEPGRIYRQAPGFRNEFGEFVAGGFTRQDVTLVSVPVSGEERAILPEGLREKELRRFFIASVVLPVDETREGDVIWHDDRFYRVEMVQDWQGFRSVLASYPFVGDITEVGLIDWDPADFAAEDWL